MVTLTIGDSPLLIVIGVGIYASIAVAAGIVLYALYRFMRWVAADDPAPRPGDPKVQSRDRTRDDDNHHSSE